MKSIVAFLAILMLISCNSFDEKEALNPVVLSETDLKLYEDLNRKVTIDLNKIRELVKTLNYSQDTTFLNTTTYNLYKIDQKKYEPTIEALKKRNIYKDDINTNSNGTIEFRLKEIYDESNLPHFIYVHSLVFNSDVAYTSPYSGEIEIKKDSVINEGCRYIIYRSHVGH